MLDDAAPPLSRAQGPLRSSVGRQLIALGVRHQGALVAGSWFAAAFATVLYVWGLNPVVFPAQDEAVVRFAAALIRAHGHPFLTLPFPDPEDMAHPRSWLTQGATALPIYAPVTLYGYAQLLRLRTVGLLLIAALPAAAIAALVAGTANLLPPARRWLAVLTPLLGFASFYWLMRPWMNLSSVLACLCWAFFFLSLWVREYQPRWLALAMLSVGAAAAIRPDYAAFLLLSAALFLLASNPREWQKVLLWGFIAGVFAVVPNLILNKATTGHALRAVYQMALDRQYGADATHGLDSSPGRSPLAILEVLFMPMGLGPLPEFTREFKKYFISMGPAPLLLFGQLAMVPLLRDKSPISRIFYGLALLFVMFFVASRLHSDLFGGSEQVGFVHHSVPRYLAPVFLFGALPPILFLGRCRQRWALFLGAALAGAVAADSGYELYVKQTSSLGWVHGWVEKNTALLDCIAPEIPSNAVLYSARDDKVLWSRWAVAFFDDDAEASASSLSRGATAGVPVFVIEPRLGRPLKRIMLALKKRQLALVRLDAHNGVYRLDGQPAAPSVP